MTAHSDPGVCSAEKVDSTVLIVSRYGEVEEFLSVHYDYATLRATAPVVDPTS